MSDNEKKKVFEDVEIPETEEFTEETVDELSNGKGDDE